MRPGFSYDNKPPYLLSFLFCCTQTTAPTSITDLTRAEFPLLTCAQLTTAYGQDISSHKRDNNSDANWPDYITIEPAKLVKNNIGNQDMSHKL